MQRKHMAVGLSVLITGFLTGCDYMNSSPSVNPSPGTVSQERLFVSEGGLNQVAVLDAATGKLIATIPVGKTPTKISYSAYSSTLWVANAGDNTVTKIDTKTLKVVGTVAVGTDPEWIDASGVDLSWPYVYVANRGSKTITVLKDADMSVAATLSTSGAPVTVSDSNNMVAEDNGTVEIFGRAPATKTPTKTFTVINGLQGGTFYGTLEQFVFLYTAYDGKVEQYDPQTYAFIQDFSAPPGAGQIYDGGSQVFVVNDVTNQLTDIDPRVSKLQFTTKVGNSPGGVSADGNTVYVANRGDDTVSAVSEYTGKVTQTFKLAAGAHPEDVAAEYAQVAATPTPSPAPTATPTATPSPTPTPSSTPGATQHLYVANGSGGNVLEYTSPFSTSSTPAVNLNIGGSVYGVASDSSYVAIEDSNGFMYIFAQPLSASASPVASFQAGRAGAQLYFDSHGNLFTGDEGAEVLEYSPPFNNTSTPAKIINGTTASFSLAMDYNNNLYAGDLGLNQIEVFAAPYSAAPTTVGQPGTYGLASYATYLYGADAGSGKIDVYNLPLSASSTPAFTIPNTDPHALAADISTGTLYVGDQHGGSGSGSIDVYNQPLSGSSTPAFSITSGVKEPVQVWIGP